MPSSGVSPLRRLFLPLLSLSLLPLPLLLPLPSSATAVAVVSFLVIPEGNLLLFLSLSVFAVILTTAKDLGTVRVTDTAATFPRPLVRELYVSKYLGPIEIPVILSEASRVFPREA